jgi:DMSO/TMAO reductase YedYZ molybdopterin-dependent catalytic subunit
MANPVAPRKPQAGLILREYEPLNLEYPFDQLDEFLTPNDLFYIRSHFKAPRLDAHGYELSIGGAVDNPFNLGYEQLRAMAPLTRCATLECAGNGRVFLAPQVEGAQWQLGAVSTAEWTGVPLPALLDRAGVEPAACEIVFEAADKGTPKEKPTPPGEIHYARSIALAKAGDVLIAYRMNGEDIPVDHGFPLRAIVPGYYGMASVKWLTGIRLVSEPFTGYWQTSDYAYWDELEGQPVRRALTTMALKSTIARPWTREFIPAGKPYEIFGAAWGGSRTIAQVEVSTDDGATWRAASFLDPVQPFVWRRWKIAWDVPSEPGAYVLKSRAKDCDGRMQPAEHDKRFGSYVIDHTIGIEVVVH